VEVYDDTRMDVIVICGLPEDRLSAAPLRRRFAPLHGLVGGL
jgi:hypothetical protein